MARITWKNVAAPSTGGVARSQYMAGKMINEGAKGIGSSLQALDTNQEEKLSAGAMQELQQIQDISKFDQLMKNGGLSQLGISADRATPELNKMLQGYRDTLEGKRTADFTHKTNQFDLRELQYDANRERVINKRADATYERSEEQRLMNERATEAAREIAMDGTILDEAGIRDAVNARAGDDLEYRDALMKAALGRSDDVTRVDENIALQPENQKRLNSAQEALRGREEQLMLERGAGKNDATRLLFQSLSEMSSEGFSNPLDSILSTYMSTEPDGDGEERKTYDETRASVTDTFNTLKDEYGDLPPELVAGVLKNTVGGKQKWRFWQDSEELENKLGDARKMLNKYRDEGDINQMQVDRNAFEADLAKIAQERQVLENVSTRLRTALSKPNPDQGTILELRTQLQQLTDREEQAGANSDGDRDAVSQKVMDDSNALIQRALDAATGGGTEKQSSSDPSTSDMLQEMGASARDGFNSVDAQVPRSVSILNELLGAPTIPGQSLGDSVRTVGNSVESAQNSINQFGTNVLQDPGGTLQGGIDWATGLFSGSNSQPPQQSAPEAAPAPDVPQRAQQPTSPQEPAPTAPSIDNTVLTEAVNDPIGTLEAIIAESGLPNEVGQKIQQTLTMLQNGREMPAASKAQFQERLQGILSQIAQQRGNDPQDPIAQLLANPEKWLNF